MAKCGEDRVGLMLVGGGGEGMGLGMYSFSCIYNSFSLLIIKYKQK